MLGNVWKCFPPHLSRALSFLLSARAIYSEVPDREPFQTKRALGEEVMRRPERSAIQQTSMPAGRLRAALLSLMCVVGGALLAVPGLAQAVPEAAASEAAAEAPGSLDLLGSWFVLIHYKDEATANPDAERWADRLWTFEMKGSRLHWTEYPMVIFVDGAGRFERLGTNRASRLLQHWEPSERQLAEIAAGLQVNSRGSKSKSLKGSSGAGYRTIGGLRVQSASVIGYHEDWYIEPGEAGPVFMRDDILGSARAENMEGRTRFSTQAISEDGQVLSGRYTRDGRQEGTFRAMRAGAPRGLETGGKTPNEKAVDLARRRGTIDLLPGLK